MSTVWVHAAAGCAAIASWLYKVPVRHDSRLPCEEPAAAHDCGSSWTILILRMLQVSLRQGSSIPRALDMVGKAVGDDCGARMSEVGSSLTRGVPWADAWHAALLQSALESSWTHGDMPGVRLESAIEQLDRDERAAIERNAAKLSVKLLMPTGLCFLPAFVLVGVIPAIASFMM
ncbi:MAG: type II secretion system F family protein [Bifidobacterium longum]|nr:type II secretion system F family protein [Bifidobacterium longum]